LLSKIINCINNIQKDFYPIKNQRKANSSSQVIKGKLDFAVTDAALKRELLDTADMSNFITVAEVMFTVCQPKLRKSLLNILRPFG